MTGPGYEIRRTQSPLALDPRLSEDVWQRVDWSPRFGRIEDGADVPLHTSAALVWDDLFLYAGFRLEDPDVRAVMTGHNDQVYLVDEDIELFLDTGAGYYELGLNALNNTYEINWTWVEHVVERRDWNRLDELLRYHDGLYFPPRPGDLFGRVGDLAFRCSGLEHATHVEGAINAPSIRDVGWTAMVKLPWSSLATIGVGSDFGPAVGTTFGLNSYRAHHRRNDEGAPVQEGWSWTPTGNANVHVPESWVTATLSERSA